MSRVRDPYARFCERDKYRISLFYFIFTLLDSLSTGDGFLDNRFMIY